VNLKESEKLLYNIYLSKPHHEQMTIAKGMVHKVPFSTIADAISFYFTAESIQGVVCAREANNVLITQGSWNRIEEQIKHFPLPEAAYFIDAMRKIEPSTEGGKGGWQLDVNNSDFADKLIGHFKNEGLYFTGYGTFNNHSNTVNINNKGATTAAHFDMETKRDHNNGYKLRFSEGVFFKLKAEFKKELDGFTFDIGMKSKNDDIHRKLGVINEAEHYKLTPIGDGKTGIQVNQAGMNKLNKLGLINEHEMGISSISTFKFIPPNGVPGRTEEVKTFLKEKPSPLIEQIAQRTAIMASTAEERTAEFHTR
jgi:hypothetical protein